MDCNIWLPLQKSACYSKKNIPAGPARYAEHFHILDYIQGGLPDLQATIIRKRAMR